MSREKKLNRTQEVVGSSPFSSTTVRFPQQQLSSAGQTRHFSPSDASV